eukprot:gnl/TRDRNA2_/TRDRNA2_80739_c0_seq1.p1 gnl/TRDRNA2_/TRDRNA2_80739_c0~~gnl/TRDRNA2_/TRDRNA2_80739_c0_seq1.p1  ORF type:complete len:262 (-),score=41.32 gnl/TRDRNA2_/TRDRNA2_80739_c0_seq1:138-923(-)
MSVGSCLVAFFMTILLASAKRTTDEGRTHMDVHNDGHFSHVKGGGPCSRKMQERDPELLLAVCKHLKDGMPINDMLDLLYEEKEIDCTGPQLQQACTLSVASEDAGACSRKMQARDPELQAAVCKNLADGMPIDAMTKVLYDEKEIECTVSELARACAETSLPTPPSSPTYESGGGTCPTGLPCGRCCLTCKTSIGPKCVQKHTEKFKCIKNKNSFQKPEGRDCSEPVERKSVSQHYKSVCSFTAAEIQDEAYKHLARIDC